MGTTLLKIAQKYEPAELLIGVDFSEKMIQQAKKDRSALPEKLSKKMGFFTANACALPYMDNQFDFVYSECVLNLVKDRDRAISEIFRVLKPNGIFCYTDFVSYERIPEVIRNDLSLVSGCRAGSLTMTQNLNVLKRSGFVNIYTKDFSYEKTKRYKEQLQSSVKLQRDFALLKQEKPDVFDFLENKVGYFFITGVKK